MPLSTEKWSSGNVQTWQDSPRPRLVGYIWCQEVLLKLCRYGAGGAHKGRGGVLEGCCRRESKVNIHNETAAFKPPRKASSFWWWGDSVRAMMCESRFDMVRGMAYGSRCGKRSRAVLLTVNAGSTVGILVICTADHIIHYNTSKSIVQSSLSTTGYELYIIS